jgi:alpha-amylase
MTFTRMFLTAGLALASSLLHATVVNAHTAAEWSDRTIYQVLIDRVASTTSDTWSSCNDLSVYCGGTWAGLQSKLDYISGMGFDAIWISPMPKNLGNDYHGYAFLDLFQVNEHFGTETDLKNLITTAHQKDIWIMLDVVGNHVAPVDLSFEQINPFNQSNYYHSKCQIEDWSNQEQVENCRLANLPDLDQNNEYVRTTLIDWVASLKPTYGFDGLRIDTVPEVHPDFWQEFSSAAGMYTVGEVFNGDLAYVSGYQQYMDGVLSYPLYFSMLNVFASRQSMYELESLLGPSGSYYSHFKNVNLLGTFIDNHDNPRFLYHQQSHVLYKNALTMTLFTVGIPIVYYGSEQGYAGGADPQNRESLWPHYDTNSDLYLFLKTLVGTRKAKKISSFEQIQRYASTDFYAFSRGDVLVCLTNSNGAYDTTVSMTYLPYANGVTVCNVLNSNDCATVTNGSLTVVMTGGLPKVYVPV